MNVNKLLSDLAQFSGTEAYHRAIPPLVLTDGALFLAKNAGCFWLFSIVSSIIPDMIRKGESFLVVKIKAADNRGVVTVEDGNYNELYRQEIAYTDFPLPEYDLFVQQSGRTWVAMLKSEW